MAASPLRAASASASAFSLGADDCARTVKALSSTSIAPTTIRRVWAMTPLARDVDDEPQSSDDPSDVINQDEIGELVNW